MLSMKQCVVIFSKFWLNYWYNLYTYW